jgi:hypothetical protein
MKFMSFQYFIVYEVLNAIFKNPTDDRIFEMLTMNYSTKLSERSNRDIVMMSDSFIRFVRCVKGKTRRKGRIMTLNGYESESQKVSSFPIGLNCANSDGVLVVWILTLILRL